MIQGKFPKSVHLKAFKLVSQSEPFVQCYCNVHCSGFFSHLLKKLWPLYYNSVLPVHTKPMDAQSFSLVLFSAYVRGLKVHKSFASWSGAFLSLPITIVLLPMVAKNGRERGREIESSWKVQPSWEI